MKNVTTLEVCAISSSGKQFEPKKSENVILGSLSEVEIGNIEVWLRSEHLALHELFGSFCSLVYKDEIPGRARLISHCVREIRNVLISHLVAEESNKLEYSKMVSEISTEWMRIRPNFAGALGVEGSKETPSSTVGIIGIDQKVVKKIDTLVTEHDRAYKTNSEKTRRLFEYFQISESDASTSLDVLAKDWKKLVDWFVSLVHERKRTDNELLDENFARRVKSFERSLLRFATAPAFFEGLEEIDAILDKANR